MTWAVLKVHLRFEVTDEGAGCKGGRRQEVRHQNSLFYADEGMIESSDPGWIQGAFSTLVRLFHRVVLKTHFGKTVRMVFRPCIRRQEHSRRWHTSKGLWVWGLTTSRGSVYECSAQSAGRRWHWGRWKSTYRRITGRQQAGDSIGGTWPPVEIHALYYGFPNLQGTEELPR